MKRLLALSIALALCFSLSACGGSSTEPASDDSTDSDASEATSSIEVEQNIFDVTLTLPADFAGDVSQE